jgi:hypothetical protein
MRLDYAATRREIIAMTEAAMAAIALVTSDANE